MKKIFVLLFAVASVFAVQAADTTAQAKPETQAKPAVQAKPTAREQVAKEKEWDFISFTFSPGVPPSEDVYDVFGVKVGLPIGFGSKAFVVGTELSVISSTTPYVYGVQGAILYNDATLVEGLQSSFIFNMAKDVRGVQFSVVNYAENSAFQVGIVNIIKNSPLPFMLGFNVKF